MSLIHIMDTSANPNRHPAQSMSPIDLFPIILNSINEGEIKIKKSDRKFVMMLAQFYLDKKFLSKSQLSILRTIVMKYEKAKTS